MATTLWKGHLSFGLVSIPVKLVRAARPEKIRMHNLQRKTGSRVRQLFVPDAPEPESPEPVAAPRQEPARPGGESKPGVIPFSREVAPARQAALTAVPLPPPPRSVAKQDLVRGFEYEKDKYVSFEPQELEAIAPRNSTTMEILEFVKFEEIDPVYLETSYYVLPDKGGEKPYALLFDALRKTGHSAVAEIVMYRRDQTVLIRPGNHGLIAHTLFHNDEVRRAEEFHADVDLVKPGEVDLAVKLVEALAAPFDPAKFKDKYRERLHQAISQKLAAGAITEAPAAASAAPVLDIVAALKASLSQARATESQPRSGEPQPRPADAKKPAGRESGASSADRTTARPKTKRAGRQ